MVRWDLTPNGVGTYSTQEIGAYGFKQLELEKRLEFSIKADSTDPITQKGLNPFFATHDSLELIFSELLSIIVASHTWF